MTEVRGYEIDISIHDPRWAELPEPDDLAKQALEAAIDQITARDFSEISIALLDDQAVQALNKSYRGTDKPTNVLSFPIPKGPMLGDIVLAYETVKREAEEKNISLQAHVQHLLIHGFYHLQGYDHEAEAEAGVMERLEILALNSLGIENPYQIERVS